MLNFHIVFIKWNGYFDMEFHMFVHHILRLIAPTHGCTRHRFVDRLGSSIYTPITLRLDQAPNPDPNDPTLLKTDAHVVQLRQLSDSLQVAASKRSKPDIKVRMPK